MAFSMTNYLMDRGLSLHEETLVTARSAKAGTILFEQQSLASIPLASLRRERCNFCLKRLEKEKLLCCEQCHSAYFCSEKCFRNAWLRFHVNLCQKRDRDTYSDVDNDAWLLERTALTLHNCLNKDITPPCLASLADALDSLVPPRSTHPKPCPIRDDVGCLGAIYDRDALSALWQRTAASTFEVTFYDDSPHPIAYAVFPLTVRHVRHSCCPNAAFVYAQGKQRLVALEDLPSQTKVTVSYVDPLATKEMRTKALQDRFGSDYACTCARCEGDLAGLDLLLDRAAAQHTHPEESERQLTDFLQTWNVLSMTQHYTNIEDDVAPRPELDVPNVTHSIGRIMLPDMYDRTKLANRRDTRRSWLDCQDPSDTRRRIIRTIAHLNTARAVPGLSLSFVRAAEKMLTQRMETGRWVEAARLSIYLHSIYCLFYHPLHPTMARHCVITARATWNAMIELELTGEKKKLNVIYEEGTRMWNNLAHNAVSSTFGDQCNLYAEVVRLQWLFNRDKELKRDAASKTNVRI